MFGINELEELLRFISFRSIEHLLEFVVSFGLGVMILFFLFLDKHLDSFLWLLALDPLNLLLDELLNLLIVLSACTLINKFVSFNYIFLAITLS